VGASAFAVAAVAASAAGQAPAIDPAKTIPTLPVDDSTPESVPPSSPSVPTESSVPLEDPAGISLARGAGTSQFFALKLRLARSSDVAAELQTIAPLGRPLPCPIDVTVNAFGVAYDADAGRFSAFAEFTSPADAEDVALFFQAMLVGTGYEQAAPPTTTGATGVESTTLEYVDGEGDAAGRLRVEVTPSERGSAVQLTVADDFEASTLGAFTGWAPELPLLEAGMSPVRAVVEVGGSDGDQAVALESTYRFADVSAVELAERFADEIVGSRLYEVDEEAGGTTTDGDRTVVHLLPLPTELHDIAVTIEPDGDGSRLTVAGAL
jgi:hypothetical protein